MDMFNLKSRSLKVTLVIDPSSLEGVSVTPGVPKVLARIDVGERRVRAELNAKSFRKVLDAVRLSGPSGVAVVLQGTLSGDNLITEAGILAQPRKQKVVEAA